MVPIPRFSVVVVTAHVILSLSLPKWLRWAIWAHFSWRFCLGYGISCESPLPPLMRPHVKPHGTGGGVGQISRAKFFVTGLLNQHTLRLRKFLLKWRTRND